MTSASHTPLVERVAFALWRDDSIRAAVRERTLEQWLDESEDTRNRWRRSAHAALAACHAEELAQAVRANDFRIRNICTRDARWFDDDSVRLLLDRNQVLLTKLDAAS